MASIGVFAMIFNEDTELLCVRMNYADKNWTTPGGRVEPEENPSEALVREVQEETGYKVSVGDLIGVYSKPYQDDIVLSFEAHILSRDKWVPNEEIMDVKWFSLETLPSEMTEVVRSRIEDGFAGKRGIYKEFYNGGSRTT